MPENVDVHGKDFGQWDIMSTTYAEAIGPMTISIVEQLVQWVDEIVPLTEGDSNVLDNGCGTGSICSVLKRKYPDTELIGTDIYSGMIDKVRTIAGQNRWENFEARVLDARNLSSIRSDSITHVFSSFMICLAPDPEKIASEMHRVLKVDGILGLAVWGEPYFRFWEEPWTKACREIMPSYKPPMIMDPEWTYAENVRQGLARAGFHGIDVRVKKEPFHWRNVEHAVEYFFKGGNLKKEEYLAS